MTPAESRRAYAYSYTSRCPAPPPQYGSPEWDALPQGPEKWAAVVIAAERTVREDTLADLELEAIRRYSDDLRRDAVNAEYRARDEQHRAAWTGRGFRPDPAIEADIEREWQEWAGGDVA